MPAPSELERLRRTEGLERTMLSLRDAREAADILAIVARGIAHDFHCSCVPYERRGGRFRRVSGGSEPGIGPEFREAELEALRLRPVVRRERDHLVGVSADGQLRALLVLERGEADLDEEDVKYLGALAAHTSLALSNALAFEQLRRYAAEGAALTEAARTILGFTELEPLADALCRLALRLVYAERAFIYMMRGGELVRVAYVAARDEEPPPERLPLTASDGAKPLSLAFGAAALLVTRMRLPGADETYEHNGFLVASRSAPFDRSDSRVIETLKSLAALAMRNVDLYEQTTRANAALGESNAFKDDLMAMFAHDFKGPLTVIMGFSELLTDTSDPEVRRNATTIVEQTRRLAKLSDDALALAATQSGGFSLKRTPADIASFVRSTAEPLDPAGDRIVLSVPPDPIVVSFDRARLRHVLDNVIGNALKYSSEPVRLVVAPVDGEVRVDVVDRGIGVPATEFDKIFSRYGRGTNARSRGIAGSGVGLYIAKKIVEVHGGRLEVASVENEGSTFSIVLPRHAELPSKANG